MGASRPLAPCTVMTRTSSRPCSMSRLMTRVPWRSQLVDPSGASLTTDGPASLGMILEAYGVMVGTADLEALAAYIASLN